MTLDIKPTSFARGVPPEERNGFYGIEQELIEHAGTAEPIVCIVTYTLDDVVQKVVKGEQYPVVKAFSIEPLHETDDIATAVKLRDQAMRARTGVTELDLPEMED